MHNGFTNQNVTSNFKKAWLDLISSVKHWRIFCTIGISDIKKRYARSRLGQFWLTVSLSVNIAVLGFVWSYLFKMPVEKYLPFIATGVIFWTFISACITEGCYAYITSTSYLKELNIPKLSYVNSLLVRNLVILGHNLIVLVPVYLYYTSVISITSILLSLAGFALTLAFLFAAVMFLSLVSLRFRDIPNIIASLMQIVFYLTPVMWQVELMPSRFHPYLILNPFAVFLSLCRDPLLQVSLPLEYWLAGIIYVMLSWAISFSLFSRFRARITYWL